MVNNPQQGKGQTGEALQKNLQQFLRQGEGGKAPIGPAIRTDTETPLQTAAKQIQESKASGENKG